MPCMRGKPASVSQNCPCAAIRRFKATVLLAHFFGTMRPVIRQHTVPAYAGLTAFFGRNLRQQGFRKRQGRVITPAGAGYIFSSKVYTKIAVAAQRANQRVNKAFSHELSHPEVLCSRLVRLQRCRAWSVIFSRRSSQMPEATQGVPPGSSMPKTDTQICPRYSRPPTACSRKTPATT